MLALAMNPVAPADSTQSVKSDTNKRTSEHPEPSSEMLALVPQHAPSKRPKLSLQTSSLPVTFGKSSTALVMAASTLPTASPTILNTFNNAYDLPRRPSPATTPASTPRLTQRPPRNMASVVSRREDEHPYKIPLGIRGILRNSPIPASVRKSSVCSNSTSPRNGRRVFFPPTKRVCYRFPLDEEITTVKYIARHADLSSSDDSCSDSDSGPEVAAEELDDIADQPTSDEERRIRARPKKALKGYSRRQIRAAAVRDRLDDARQQTLAPKTPSDRKKRRRWEWTLGPLDEKGVGRDTPDPTATPPTDDSAMPPQEQASTSLSVKSPMISDGQSIHSPAPQSPQSSLTLPQTITLPASPLGATTAERREAL